MVVLDNFAKFQSIIGRSRRKLWQRAIEAIGVGGNSEPDSRDQNGDCALPLINRATRASGKTGASALRPCVTSA